MSTHTHTHACTHMQVHVHTHTSAHNAFHPPQGGAAPVRHNPYAGKTSESHMSTGSNAPLIPLGPNGLPIPVRRPAYAGKTSETRISYEAGTMTVPEVCSAGLEGQRGGVAAACMCMRVLCALRKATMAGPGSVAIPFTGALAGPEEWWLRY